MSDRDIEMDNGWVPSDSAVAKKLYAKGYSVGGYIDKGVPRYVLYRRDGVKFERVHEFDTSAELNNMLKLILED